MVETLNLPVVRFEGHLQNPIAKSVTVQGLKIGSNLVCAKKQVTCGKIVKTDESNKERLCFGT